MSYSYVSNRLHQAGDGDYNTPKSLEGWKDDNPELEEKPDEELQERYISNVLQKLNNRLIGTNEFLGLHNEDQYMYPKLSFDIKNRRSDTIFKKIMNKDYKSEFPTHTNKFLQNKFLKHGSTRTLTLPSTFNSGSSPLSKTIPTKTKEVYKAPIETKKKIYTSMSNFNDSERNKIVAGILGNDVVDIITKNPSYERIIPEIIKESDFSIKESDNEIIQNYLTKLNIDKNIQASKNLRRPFLDVEPKEETYDNMVQWHLNNIESESKQPIIINNNFNEPPQTVNKNNDVEDNYYSEPVDNTKQDIPYETDTTNYVEKSKKTVDSKFDDPKIYDSSDYISQFEEKKDIFNIDYNNFNEKVQNEIPYRENTDLNIESEVNILEEKINFIDTIIKAPISKEVISSIESEKPIPAVGSLNIGGVTEPLSNVDTSITSSDFIDENLLYVDNENFDKNWSQLIEVVNESSFDISENDINLVYKFIRWLVNNKNHFGIEFTSSTNPYYPSHFELIHNGDVSDTVGDLLLNVASHQLEEITNPIWDIVEINDAETLDLYSDDNILDVNRLTAFKMLAGYYNRSTSQGNKIIFHSFKRLTKKVEKQLNIQISGLDELLDTLNDDTKNEYFRSTTTLLDNLRYQTDNFYFNDYAKLIINNYKSDIEQKYINSNNKNETITSLYRNIYKNNTSTDVNTTNVIEMIFNDYFSGDIASFLGMKNSEVFMNTNNEIGEIMNEIKSRSLISDSLYYSQFTIAIITLIIGTVYLTFKSMTLKQTTIKGAETIIRNLCITIRTIKNQMMSNNLDNDNVYTVVYTFSQTLKQIHENRIIEFQKHMQIQVEIKQKKPILSNIDIIDEPYLQTESQPVELTENIPQLDAINPDEITIDEPIITHQQIPDSLIDDLSGNKAFEEIQNFNIIPDNETELEREISSGLPIPTPMQVSEEMNTSKENKNKIIISETGKKEKKFERMLKSMVDNVQKRVDEPKNNIIDMIVSKVNDKNVESKSHRKKVTEKVIKDIKKMSKISTETESDIPSKTETLVESGVLKTKAEAEIPNINIFEPDVKRISSVRRKVLRMMKITELSADQNKKLKRFITDTILTTPAHVSNKKIAQIVVDIIKAEGTDLVKNKTSWVVSKIYEADKTTSEPNESVISEEAATATGIITEKIPSVSTISYDRIGIIRKRVIKKLGITAASEGNMKKLETLIADTIRTSPAGTSDGKISRIVSAIIKDVGTVKLKDEQQKAITDNLDTNSLDVTKIIKELEEYFNRNLEKKEEQAIRKKIVGISKKHKTKSSRRITRKIIKVIEKAMGIDDELTTKHKDLIYSVVKKREKGINEIPHNRRPLMLTY